MSTRPGARDRANRDRDRARAGSPSDATTPDTPHTPFRFGYGTNGLTDLRLDDALGLLADLGYDGVGLTLDHMHLDPLARDLSERTRRVGRRLNSLGLGVTVETGARYVLDPRRKHGPSLLDPDPDDRSRRVDLLLRAVRVAADLGAHAVHCFSGITPAGTDHDTAWHRLTEALVPVLEAATAAGVPLAIEPEPGHLLATLADFHHLRQALDDPAALGLTLDIGHCQCLEPLSPVDCVRAAAPWLRHVQIEDMRRGVHEHLPFGDGEIDFPPVLAALSATGYQGLTVVELPRHSHAGPQYAEHSLHFLRRTAPSTAKLPADSPESPEPPATPPTSAQCTQTATEPGPAQGQQTAVPSRPDPAARAFGFAQGPQPATPPRPAQGQQTAMQPRPAQGPQPAMQPRPPQGQQTAVPPRPRPAARVFGFAQDPLTATAPRLAQAAPASRYAKGPQVVMPLWPAQGQQTATPPRPAPAAPETDHPLTATTPKAAPVTASAPPARYSTTPAERSTS